MSGTGAAAESIAGRTVRRFLMVSSDLHSGSFSVRHDKKLLRKKRREKHDFASSWRFWARR